MLTLVNVSQQTESRDTKEDRRANQAAPYKSPNADVPRPRAGKGVAGAYGADARSAAGLHPRGRRHGAREVQESGQMNRAVGADTLNAAETRRFVEAIDLMRAAKVADSVHSAPIRDGADRLV